MHRHHASNFTRASQRALDESDTSQAQRSYDDERGDRDWDGDERGDGARTAHNNGAEQLEHVELDVPRTPRTYRPETGLSYDQYRRSRYYDGYVEGQLKSGATPFRYRHGEYAPGGERSSALAGSPARTFRAPKNYKRSDARIHEEVCERLGSMDDLDPSDLEVAVQGGEVTLSGSVPKRSMRFIAEDVVAAVFGVEEVHNQLRVAGAAQTRADTEATVRSIRLSAEDEALRGACEREAAQHWPGARVFVDALDRRYRAAVYLPEDGLQPDVSAQQSAPRHSAREALEELLGALRSQPSLRAH